MNFTHLYTDCFHQTLKCQDSGILVSKWLPATSSMSLEMFKASCLTMASLAQRHEGQSVLIDGTDFYMGQPEDSFWAWRGENISPIYNSAGVKKFAFLWKEGSPLPPNSGSISEPDKFPTTHFTNRDEAMTWLGE